MDPFSIALAAGSLGSGLAGIFGGGDQGQQDMNSAVQQIIATQVPDPEQQKIEYQHYVQTGELSPQLESAIKQDPSAFNKIVTNQQYASAQNKALSQLQEQAENGGLNLSDKANLQETLSTNANKDKANRDALVDSAERRGQGGSGLALQAQLEGAQASGDQNAQSRLSALGQAQNRELQAIQDSGSLATNLQNSDYQRQSNLAQAQDKINQFNTANAQSVQQRNVAAQNAAQAQNLQTQQNIANQNTDLNNKATEYNSKLQQQNYENQLQKANAVAGVYGQAAGQANQDRSRQTQGLSALGSGLGQLGTSYQNQQNLAATQAQNQSNWNNWFNLMKQKQNTGATV